MGATYYLPTGPITSYNQVITNVGEHFDGYSGIFEAPHSGVYEFWVDGEVANDKRGSVSLRVNGEVDKEWNEEPGEGTIYSVSGLTGKVVLLLNAFDKVSLQNERWSDYNDNAIRGDTKCYFTFGGRSL